MFAVLVAQTCPQLAGLALHAAVLKHGNKQAGTQPVVSAVYIRLGPLLSGIS